MTTPTRYPLDYMDRGCFAATSRERGSSNAPTWELIVTGRLEPADCVQALGLLVRSYPSCTSYLRPDPAAAPKRHSQYYEVDPKPSMEQLFHYRDIEKEPPDALSSLREEIRNRFIDVYTEYPFRVTLVRTSARSAHVFFQQHHALADGRAFIEMLGDFARLLEAVRQGEPIPTDSLVPVPRRDEFSALEISRLRGVLWSFAGLYHWLRIFRSLTRNPLTRLLENSSSDWTGSNGMLHLVLERQQLETWRALRKPFGFSLTTLLGTALALASRRLNVEHGILPGAAKLSIVAETRPRHGRFRSFANHLAGLVVDLSLGPEPDPIGWMQSIQAQIQDQVRSDVHKKRLVFERGLTRSVALDDMRTSVFQSDKLAGNLNLSNLISLGFPVLAGTDWKVDAIEITTPVIPPYGVMLTVIDYNGRLRFNFNYKASVVSREQVERLRDYFVEALSQLEDALRTGAARPQG